MSTTQEFPTKTVADDKSVDSDSPFNVDYDGPFDSAKAHSAFRLSADIPPEDILTDLTAEQIEALSIDELEELVMDWYDVPGEAEEFLYSIPWTIIDHRPMFHGSQCDRVVDFEIDDTELSDIEHIHVGIDVTLHETEAGYAARMASLCATQNRA